ncbi:polysaccharide deacetylase family sporulation protein PdaB [Agaribacter marinus]|uniref:Polysaccharide deacetylase family sporulation protein PdaB n=1 Tax=Virgibacillus salarius TaxID=447199 RepID=A0A941IAS6_9BACI|nr:polysaccharide deacetylase family sporulation protein PdaB [Virgibacillus salarius]MBR7798274.1 polysaccharide deacetylase family sporulation protein PdaB [Virgibacillus salarius]NAZ10982.1 polysaccharide deacetylase family sporulation protein PdaB [Agaribacter marinus]
MEHFYVWRFNRWKRWLVVILFALFTATFIWFERNGSFSVFSNKEPTALTKGNANESDIALTFNISWGEERVYDILKTLEEKNVQATFFVSGEWAERHPDILKKITEGKHDLGILGYRYKSYLDQDIEEVQRDLKKAREAFDKLGYDDVNLLRPPSGHFNKEIIEVAENMDYKVIHWNVNPNDWKNPGTDSIVDTVMKKTTNGDILLFHASDSAKQTASALKTILPGLKNKGFTFVSITELINQAHAEPKLVD